MHHQKDFGEAVLAAAGLSLCAVALAILFWLALMQSHVQGRELIQGQWDSVDPKVRAWYGRQTTQDTGQSCCGEADAYYADSIVVTSNGTVFAIITDTREDFPLGRPHIPLGTKFLVPPQKTKDTRADPNPTGHTVIFVRYFSNSTDDGDWAVLCYLPNDGI